MKKVNPKTIVLLLVPLPRGKISSDFLLPTACCSGCGCVPIIKAFGVWWLPTCTTVGPQVFLEGVGGWEKWCHVLCFVSVLLRVGAELGCVVSFVTLIMCGEKKNEAEMGTSAACWTSGCQNMSCKCRASALSFFSGEPYMGGWVGLKCKLIFC